MKKIWFLVFLIIALSFSACRSNLIPSLDESEQELETEDSKTSEDKETTVEKPANEKPANENPVPLDFELSDSQGELRIIEDYHQGKLLFLNFFTTWCKYCVEEMPMFQEVYESYSDQIEIVAVNVTYQDDKSTDEVIKWFEDKGFTYPLVLNTEESQTKNFNPYIQGFPTTFVYGPTGDFLGYVNALDKDTMMAIIEEYGPKAQ